MRSGIAFLLSLLTPLAVIAQTGETGDLEIRVIQGAGALYAAGSRGGEVRVLVTDKAGLPVREAVVSFLMPAGGPGGTFASGYSADVVVTGVDGMAVERAVRWNKNAGTLRIRVSAAKGQARASVEVPVELVAAGDSKASLTKTRAARSRKRTIVTIACAAAGSIAAGLLLSRRSKSTASLPAGDLNIDLPTITVGGF